MEHPSLVSLKAFDSRFEAEVAKGALENAGIKAVIQSDSVGGMREHIAWSGAGFQILVREGDVAAANEVLTPVVDPDLKDNNPDDSWRKFT